MEFNPPGRVTPGGRIALDIGGTLAKVVYWSSEPSEDPLDLPHEGGFVHFSLHQSKDVDTLIEFLRLHQGTLFTDKIVVTGGGAYKF
jgi:pantothenate kinase